MNINKMTGEKVDEYFERLVKEGYKLKSKYQDITLEDISTVLKKLNQYSDDKRDVVWCLLNNELPSLFSNTENFTISDGASIAHIGGYIGILERHSKQLDREGRDYWVKPLIEIAAIEPITLKDGKFIEGHIKAKSPNSAYRLSSYFSKLLKTVNNDEFEQELSKYIDSVDERLNVFSLLEATSKTIHGDSAHKKLIEFSISTYAEIYLPGFIPIFTDYSDGNRVTEEEKKTLNEYGIIFGTINDVWPDAILINPKTDTLWFIEAVTSDGEADTHKVEGLKTICKNSGKKYGGVTTTYETYKRFASRQQSENNIARDTYVWILECPDRQFKVC